MFLGEGHVTRPRDIERALSGLIGPSPDTFALEQVEAAAHVRVQAEVDRLAAARAFPSARHVISEIVSRSLRSFGRRSALAMFARDFCPAVPGAAVGI